MFRRIVFNAFKRNPAHRAGTIIAPNTLFGVRFGSHAASSSAHAAHGHSDAHGDAHGDSHGDAHGHDDHGADHGGHGHDDYDHVSQPHYYLSKFCLITTYLWIFHRIRQDNGQLFVRLILILFICYIL